MDLKDICIRTINDAFDPIAIDSFLKSMNMRGADVAQIQEAAPDLNANPTGGALQETPTLSFWDAYQKLDRDSRRRVAAHYQAKVKGLSDQLRRKYPKAFRE